MWRWCLCLLAAVAAAAAAPGRAPSCPPGTPGPPAACSAVTNGSGNQHQFQVCDKYLLIIEGAKTLKIVCQNNTTFECPSLPSFPNRVSVLSITMSGCPLPAQGSVRAVLAKLNVTLLSAGTSRLQLSDLPPAPALNADHFAGLDQLRKLQLQARDTQHVPDAGFLGRLQNLHTLEMLFVQLPPDELASQHLALRRLELRHAGVRVPPPLKTVVYLKVEEEEIEEFDPPPSMTNLTLSSRATALSVVDVPSLESLELTNWTERSPVPLRRCGALRSLWLIGPAVETLPARWVSACRALRVLVIRRARALADLPTLLLADATALEHLEVSDSALKWLPKDLLHDAPGLHVLRLLKNHLQTLSGSSLEGPRALRILDLSRNELTATAVAQLANLTRLQELNLQNNTHIGDVCAPRDSSPLIHMKNLTTLNLSLTGITRICSDWRVNLTELKVLSLQHTRVTRLQFEDLEYERRKATGAYVVLDGAPVSVVLYSRGQTQPAASGVRVQLKGELDCNCSMYWTRRALGLSLANVPVTGLRCKGRRLLKNLSLDEMVCPHKNCVPGCECDRRDYDEPAVRGATQLVRVRCARANLTRVPRLPAAPGTAYDLLLPHNHIANLTAGDLPPLLRHLDLTNNTVQRVDEASAVQLADVAQLLLAGNPLDCDCGAEPLQRVLAARRDGAGAHCSSGGPLGEASLVTCADEARGRITLLAAGLAGGLLALAAATVALGAWLAPRDWWLAVKVPLHRRGLGRVQDVEVREYDAFLSFAHEDEERARAVVERLERGAPPYRLCLHYRDWVPGRLIERQLEESVARSHRTVALVSRHYLASRWARAEFRSAQALALRSVRPRLVVVLLEPAEALPLDAELRGYLAANTYVRWGDPWFWDKLQLALPPPRRRASPAGS